MLPNFEKIELVYRGTDDGFLFSDFERKFFNKQKTVWLLKSKDHNKIFGGYTDIPWTNITGFKKGNGNSFLFSLNDDFNFIIYKCLRKEREIYQHSH